MSSLGLRMLLTACTPSLEPPVSGDHLTQGLSLAVTVRGRENGDRTVHCFQVLSSLWLFSF